MISCLYALLVPECLGYIYLISIPSFLPFLPSLVWCRLSVKHWPLDMRHWELLPTHHLHFLLLRSPMANAEKAILGTRYCSRSLGHTSSLNPPHNTMRLSLLASPFTDEEVEAQKSYVSVPGGGASKWLSQESDSASWIQGLMVTSGQCRATSPSPLTVLPSLHKSGCCSQGQLNPLPSCPGVRLRVWCLRWLSPHRGKDRHDRLPLVTPAPLSLGALPSWAKALCRGFEPWSQWIRIICLGMSA